MSKLPIFDFWGLALAMMRRILYLGTRTQVFPETPEELGLRLKADILKWRGGIDAAKITLE